MRERNGDSRKTGSTFRTPPYAQLMKSRSRLAEAQLPVDDPRLAYLRGALTDDFQPSTGVVREHPDLELQARAAVMSLDAAEFSSRALIAWTRWLVVATFMLAIATGALIWVTAFPPHRDPTIIKVPAPIVAIMQKSGAR
jgi:hypothetical protein